MPPISNSLVSKKTLVVFVKSPIPGEVKTRLMPALEAQESAELYRCFVCDLLKRVSKVSNTKCLVAYQPNSKIANLSWTGLKPLPDFFRQEGKSLGERLIHAFGAAFGRGGRQVVIIGSDSPTLPVSYIEQAFQALETADVVLGPATDGGYYLIGLSRPCLRLFEDVSWSTDQVFERTAKNAQNQGYTLRILAPHYDIDTVQDLLILHKDLEKNPSLAPLTEKLLSKLIKTKALFASF